MNEIFADAVVGRKNIGFGIVLFLILGVAVGVPLTICRNCPRKRAIHTPSDPTASFLGLYQFLLFDRRFRQTLITPRGLPDEYLDNICSPQP